MKKEQSSISTEVPKLKPALLDKIAQAKEKIDVLEQFEPEKGTLL